MAGNNVPTRLPDGTEVVVEVTCSYCEWAGSLADLGLHPSPCKGQVEPVFHHRLAVNGQDLAEYEHALRRTKTALGDEKGRFGTKGRRFSGRSFRRSGGVSDE